MDGQLDLAGNAVESIHVQIGYTWPEGWSATFGVRRLGQTWEDATQRRYSRLNRPELVQVVTDELERALGL